VITDKQAAMDLISTMPDEVSTETIVAELEFKLLILRRREAARSGATVSHAEAKQRLGRWLNSAGQ
jgi:hypothetical protein